MAAQQPERGFQSASSYAYSALEAVNLANGNLTLNLPIASLPAGRGSGPGYTVGLQYDSKLWESKQQILEDGSTNEYGNRRYQVSTLHQSARGGWRLAKSYKLVITDRLYHYAPSVCWLEDPIEHLNFRWKVEMEFPDGSVKQFFPTIASSSEDGFSAVDRNGKAYQWTRNTVNGVCVLSDSYPQLTTSGMNYVTMDGSHLRLFIPYQSDNWKLYSPTGTVVENLPPTDSTAAQRTTDRNGNYVDYKNNGNIVDQLGRSIEFTNDSNGDTIVTTKGVAGTTVSTKIDWSSRWVQRNYTRTADSNAASNQVYGVLSMPIATVAKIVFPGQSGSQEINFDYYGSTIVPGIGTETSGFGELKEVELPTGASTFFEYDQSGDTTEKVLERYASSKTLTYDEQHDGGPPTQRTEEWTYAISKWGGGVTHPNGAVSGESKFYNQYVTSWESGQVYGITNPDKTVVERLWGANLPLTVSGSGGPWGYGGMTGAGNANGYVRAEFTTLPYSDGTIDSDSPTAIKEFRYDKNGNVTAIMEYDWVPRCSVPRSGTNCMGHVTGLPSSGLTLKRKTVSIYYNQASDADSASSNSNSYADPASPKLKNVLKATEIQDGNGVPVSRSEFFYDDPNERGNLIETRTWDNTKAGLYPENATGNKLYTNGSVANYVSTTTAYDAYGNPTLLTDANGNQTQITYGPINGPTATFSGLYPTQTISAFGTSVARTSTTTHDFHTGLVTTATDVDNNVSNVTEYDALGRATKVRAAAGTTFESWTRTEYNDAARRVIVRSDVEAVGDGRKVVVQHYDQLGRVRLSRTLEDAAIEDPYNEQHGIKVETRYQTGNPNSYQITSNPFRAATATAAGGEPTMGWTRSKSWNTGRKQQVETFSGAALPAPWGTNANSTGVVTTDIDANATIVTDQAGKQRRSISNALGQLIRVDEPDKTSGQLGSVTAPVQSTSYEYNSLGKMVHVQQGVQHRWFMYDSLGRLLRVKQPEQDINGALDTTGNPGNNSWTAGFTYDNNGNVLTAKDAKNTQITNTYDALNRPLTRIYSDGTPTVTNSYDGAGMSPTPSFAKGKLTRVTSSVSESRYTSFDVAGRVKQFQQITDGQTYTSSYDYNLSGALTKETYPSGRVVEDQYDASGDLAKILGKATPVATERTYASNFAYSADGKIERLRLGSGVWESAKFNSRLQVTELSVGWGPTSGYIWRMGTEYGEVQTNGTVDATKNSGNIGKQTVTFNGLPQPFVQTFKYDALQRLTEAKETNNGTQTWREVFDYDRYGNRTAHEKYAGGSTEIPQTDETRPEIDNTRNRFKSTEGYTFDANGNIVVDHAGRQFTFNGDNKQTQVKDASNNVVGTYYFDGKGQRVKKVVGNDTTIFVYSNGKLIAEYSTEAPPQNPTTRFTVTDQLGSPRVILDSAGNVVSRRDFLPFGEEIAPDETYRTTARKYGQVDHVKQKFTGYQNDEETGLDFAEARMYENRHGRFTAVDPLLASGKSSDPQTFNRYVYVRNSPLVMTDPTGLVGDYFTRDGRYIGDDGKNDGKVYFAEEAKRGNGKIYLLTDSIRETTLDAVLKTQDKAVPLTPGTDSTINELAAGVNQGVDDALSGMAKGAGNFAIGAANSITQPLGPAGGMLGVPNPFAVDPIPYDNARQAAYGSSTEVGIGVGTIVAGGALVSRGAAPSVVPATENAASKTSGLERQLQLHQDKLVEYARNPYAHDNRGHLQNSPESRHAQIIQGRVRNLVQQIRNFEKQIK